jgi:hypothetical protein
MRRRDWRQSNAYPRPIRNGVHGDMARRRSSVQPSTRVGRYTIRFSWRRPFVFLAFCFVVAVMFVNAVDPYSGATASPYFRVAPLVSMQIDGQDVYVSADGIQNAGRDQVTIEKKVTAVPAAGVPDPDSAKAIGFKMVMERGWGVDQYDCLESLWDRESNWNAFAENPSSGAYGIPQSLPGDKMATAGADWQTNPVTQILWGLGYIEARYGSPCGAWAHSEDVGWY